MAVDAGLSERKLIILKAIIQNYLETGEPVGSQNSFKIHGTELEFRDDTQ